jgi:hypothetical protein
MSKYFTKQLGSKTIGKESMKTSQLYKAKGQKFNFNEIQDLLKTLQASAKKKNENIQFLISGLNGDKKKNLTRYDGTLIPESKFDDYYGGLDKNITNTIKFTLLYIS